MNLIGHRAHLVSAQQVLFEVWQSGCCRQSYKEILVTLNAIGFAAGWNFSSPTNQAWNALTAFPGSSFLTAERSIATIRPHNQLVSIVRAVNDDRIVGNTEVIQLLEYGADMFVMFQHPGAHDIFFCPTFIDCHLHILAR